MGVHLIRGIGLHHKMQGYHGGFKILVLWLKCFDGIQFILLVAGTGNNESAKDERDNNYYKRLCFDTVGGADFHKSGFVMRS
jgi:hypothetical protein